METMSKEEAAAWAEMRAAFGEADEVPPSASKKEAAEAAGMTAEEEEAAALSAVREAFGESGSAAPAADGRSGEEPGKKRARTELDRPKMEVSASAETALTWLQEQTDRLVGEVQRLAGGPFSPRLLSALWELPLDDQSDILLGIAGTDLGAADGAEERSERIWSIVEDELKARTGGDDGGRPSAREAAARAVVKPVKAKKVATGRRSRSPSI